VAPTLYSFDGLAGWMGTVSLSMSSGKPVSRGAVIRTAHNFLERVTARLDVMRLFNVSYS
jgi:hypothetical protein